jgi:PAS domain S-box-containing protein
MNEKDFNKLAILKGAVENTNEAFVTIDQSHTVMLFNRAAERTFGFDRAEVVGHDFDIVLGPRCHENHRKAVARYLRTRDPRLIGHETEFVATRKNGETFPASISFSVAEIRGRFFFTGIVRDMSETKSLQEKVMRSERLAALGQVVAEISHEIKNPLTLIGGFARQLIRTASDQKTRSKLEIITQEVHRLESFLGELRELYRATKPSLERFDINDLLQEIYALTRENCEAKKIKLNLRTQKGPLPVKGDRNQLKQVFLNLVNNGIESMHEGGNLSIASTLSGDTVHVAITDEGHGIPDSVREKIFTPFFTTKKQGTGLGLSITKRILEDHPGSSLTLASQKGKGTTVKVALTICDTP